MRTQVDLSSVKDLTFLIVAYCPLVYGFTWLIERKRTAHFIVVDDVSVPAEKKSKMML